jgi:hypothetical protein
MSGVWSELQTTVGETSQGTWVGWEGVPDQVWDSSDTTLISQRDHVEAEGDRAKVETVGEGSDLCQGTRGAEAGAGSGGAEEKDDESEGVESKKSHT